jgi:hypothetical protein
MQGCQISLGTIQQNGEIFTYIITTKLSNGNKNTKWTYNIPKHTNKDPLKFTKIGFWYENKSSGNLL